MTYDPERRWTTADVPSGPYFHGSRKEYGIGDLLLTDVVNNQLGEEDDRLMCFASTSIEIALRWAHTRGVRHGGDSLFVYEVELIDPEVDVNAHRPGVEQPISSVMSPCGQVLRLAHSIPVSQYVAELRSGSGT